VPELKLLLKWKKTKPTSSKKTDLIHAFANHPSPPNAVPWSVGEDMNLVTLQSDNIGMTDTALGVATATQMARAVTHNLSTLYPETRAMLKRALEEEDPAHVTGAL
jgi:hypothetical protein